MKIAFIPNFSYQTFKGPIRQGYLTPLKCDTFCFTSKNDGRMKKSGYEGFDYHYLDKVNNQLPQNVFATKEGLNEAAKAHLKELYSSEKLKSPVGSSDIEVDKQRIIGEWMCGLKDIPKTAQCAIVSSLIADLAFNSKRLPEEFDKEAFQKTYDEISATLSKNKSATFNFNNQYKQNLKIKYINEAKEKLGLKTDKSQGFWMKIPSYVNDGENYQNNVKCLKALSSDFWCTKEGEKARNAIANDDFYLYIKNDEAKIGIRMYMDSIFDVQGKYNDYLIPFKHIDKVEELISENNFQICSTSKFHTVRARAHRAQELYEKNPEAIQNKDYFEIMKTLGLKPKKLESGLYEIEEYNGFPDELLYFKKRYKITEKEFFSKIGRIRNDAKFSNTTISDLMNLKEIGGNAIFTVDKENKENGIKSLGKLERIGGNAIFYDSVVEDLGELTEIGGKMNCFGECHLQDLGKLKHIKGNAELGGKLLECTRQLETLGNREFIESRLNG